MSIIDEFVVRTMLRQIIAKLDESSSSFPGERALNEHFEDIYYRPKTSINGHGLLLRLREANIAMAAVFQRGVIPYHTHQESQPGECDELSAELTLVVTYLGHRHAWSQGLPRNGLRALYGFPPVKCRARRPRRTGLDHSVGRIWGRSHVHKCALHSFFDKEYYDF